MPICFFFPQFDRSKGKSSSHSQRKEKWKKDSSARSAPHDACKTSKRKSPHFEDRMDIPRHKSKARGGWTGGDDLDDLPFKKYKSNAWGSPSTPKKTHESPDLRRWLLHASVLTKAQSWLCITELELFTQCKEARVFVVKIRCQKHPCPVWEKLAVHVSDFVVPLPIDYDCPLGMNSACLFIPFDSCFVY